MIFILVLLCPGTAALRVKFEKDCVHASLGRAGANSVHAFHVASSAVAPCFRYWMVAGRMRNWMHWLRVRIIIIVLLFSDRLPAGELTQ